MSSVALRPSSGSDSIRSFSITVPMEDVRVSTSGAAASTDTVSARLPSPKATSITGFELTCSTMPVREYVRNP
ncbi:hypothetical protein D3C83_190030 [compost metagenome]